MHLTREVQSYNKKAPVYTFGQRPRALYFVVSGKVKTVKTSEDAKEFITGIYGEGEYFGYAPILENTNYKDEAVSLEETMLMVIPREDFLQLISNDREIAHAFIKLIAKNITVNENTLLNLAYNSVRKKVAYGLIQLKEKYKTVEIKNPVLALSREHMAQTIGIATESLIRTLAQFKDEKLISMNAGHVMIIDDIKLAALPN